MSCAIHIESNNNNNTFMSIEKAELTEHQWAGPGLPANIDLTHLEPPHKITLPCEEHVSICEIFALKVSVSSSQTGPLDSANLHWHTAAVNPSSQQQVPKQGAVESFYQFIAVADNNTICCTGSSIVEWQQLLSMPLSCCACWWVSLCCFLLLL